jgi:hypothetical protein
MIQCHSYCPRPFSSKWHIYLLIYLLILPDHIF